MSLIVLIFIGIINLFRVTQCTPVWKIGNLTNQYIYTDQKVLFNVTLYQGATISYPITLPTPMTLPNLQAGIGVIGLNSIIEKVQGWTLTVNQLTATSLTVQAVSNYQPNSLSSQLSFMKIRYIVSTRPNLDINFTQINFMSYQNVSNVYTQDDSCSYIRCRKTLKAISYQPKDTNANIMGIATIAGYTTTNILDEQEIISSQLYNNSNIYYNDTTQNYYGLAVSLDYFTSTTCTVTVTVYGFVSINQISIYYVVYQSLLTNTYTTRDVSGYATVGCYYDRSTCVPAISAYPNNSFTTATTYLNNFYNHSYFFGLSSFIVYQNIQQSSLITSINQIPDHTFSMQTNSSSGSGQYVTYLSFTGNVDKLFSFKFGYFIDTIFDCPTTGQIYHVNSYTCDSQCPAGYYINYTTKYCVACHPICYNCTGPLPTMCTACNSVLQHRQLSNISTCVCQVQHYYEDNVSINCQACSYTCLTCDFSSRSSCTSCVDVNISLRLDDGNRSCPCIDGYYDNGGPTCLRCDYTCILCSTGGSNGCTTCPDELTYFRRSTTNGSCSCITGYYNFQTQVLCLPCIYSCLNCTNGNTCTACNAGQHRSSVISSACPCDTGYYDDGVNGMCLPCFKTCYTCIGPTLTDCTKCDKANQSRILNSQNSRCDCMTGYFQFNYTCIACHITCLNCTNNTFDTCINCNQSNFRTFVPVSNTCICDTGYFQANNLYGKCGICNATCYECVGNSNNCTKCLNNSLRILTGSSCPCIDGYADVSGTCKICIYSCVTCSGILATQCLSCPIQRIQSTTSSPFSCICANGTYDDGMVVPCKPCHSQCLTCTAATNDTCTSCKSTYMRWIPSNQPNQCFCIGHYYDIGNPTCEQCDSKCQNCTYISTNCLSCYASQFRQLNSSNMCTCINHYYQTTGNICLQCAVTCIECYGISTNCTSCPLLRTLANNSCICISHYYQNLTDGTCQECDILCVQCVNSSTTCLVCQNNLNRYLSNTQCICTFGFYDDGNLSLCQPCPSYCIGCSSPTSCLSCDTSSNRNLTAGSCSCIDGYYDIGINSDCKPCSPSCVTCSDYDVCTSCDASLHRTLILSMCKCIGSYYDNYALSNISMCSPCDYSCETCSGPNQDECVTCISSRNFTNHTCPCNNGYYETGNICYPCDINCKTCEGLLNNCTSCFSKLSLFNGTCLCNSSQFYSAGNCFPCDIRCKQCDVVATNCTECNQSQNTIMVGSSCVCQSGSFQDNSTLACFPCHQTCVQCTGPYSNNCVICNTSAPYFRQLNTKGECSCQSGFFLDPISSFCSPCDSTCTSCINLSSYNCTGCISNYSLIGSYCQPNVECTNYYYNGLCLDVCPPTSFPTSNNICDQCTNGCQLCVSANSCITCLKGFFFNSVLNTCQAYCQNGFYVDSSGNCVSCMTNCFECQWNPTINTLVCLKCAPGFYLKNQIQCSIDCLPPSYILVNSLCLKCVGNCLTCGSLSTSDCILCKPNTAFLDKVCYDTCPDGYYLQHNIGTQLTCQPCNQSCTTCQQSKCTTCKQGTYISNGQCVAGGTYYNMKQNKIQKCHPNCITCTNSSFSSCIICQPFRGDDGQIAISGYCECKIGSIDLGNGVCDYLKYIQMQKITQSLVSFSSSSTFMMGLASMTVKNYIGFIFIGSYFQSYSTFYYLNSSVVMNINNVLYEYRKTNINSFIESSTKQKKNQTVTRRMLFQYQNKKSLFLRNQPFQYLIQWGAIPAFIITFIWSATFVLYLYICCCGYSSSKVVSCQQQVDLICKHEGYPSVNQISLDKINNLPLQNKSNRTKSNDSSTIFNKQNGSQKSNVIKQNFYFQQLSTINKYVVRFFKTYHQIAAIVIHFIFSGQIVLYATISIKLLIAGEGYHSPTLQVLSIIFMIYMVGYTLRLFIGVISLYIKNKTSPLSSDKMRKSSIQILFHRHQPLKNHILNAIYLPMLLFRNQLISLFMVALSYNPIYQIISCLVVIVVFTIYSFVFCPYPLFQRICWHISQVLFVLQIGTLWLAIETQYGQSFSLQILNQSGRMYKFAWMLQVLNFLQIGVYIFLSVVLIVTKGKQQICCSLKIKNSSPNKEIQKKNGDKVQKKQNKIINLINKKSNKIKNQSQQTLQAFTYDDNNEATKQKISPINQKPKNNPIKITTGNNHQQLTQKTTDNKIHNENSTKNQSKSTPQISIKKYNKIKRKKKIKKCRQQSVVGQQFHIQYTFQLPQQIQNQLNQQQQQQYDHQQQYYSQQQNS